MTSHLCCLLWRCISSSTLFTLSSEIVAYKTSNIYIYIFLVTLSIPTFFVLHTVLSVTCWCILHETTQNDRFSLYTEFYAQTNRTRFHTEESETKKQTGTQTKNKPTKSYKEGERKTLNARIWLRGTIEKKSSVCLIYTRKNSFRSRFSNSTGNSYFEGRNVSFLSAFLFSRPLLLSGTQFWPAIENILSYYKQSIVRQRN